MMSEHIFEWRENLTQGDTLSGRNQTKDIQMAGKSDMTTFCSLPSPTERSKPEMFCRVVTVPTSCLSIFARQSSDNDIRSFHFSLYDVKCLFSLVVPPMSLCIVVCLQKVFFSSFRDIPVMSLCH